MLNTELVIHSYSNLPPGSTITQIYIIEIECTTRGELPSNNIFVYTINDPANAAIDTYTRVATTTDIMKLLPERDAAILAGSSLYVSNFITKSYTDIEVAIAAKSALKNSVNTLCHAWIKYRDDFISDDNLVIVLPDADLTNLDKLIDNYREAKNGRKEVEAQIASNNVSIVQWDIRIQEAKKRLKALKSTLADLKDISNMLSTYVDKVSSEGAGAAAYRVDFNDTLSTFITEARSEKTLASTTLHAAEEARYNLEREGSNLLAQLSTATEKENSSLADLLEVSPDFDTESV